ncbi:uncharacterized protein KY384_008048 [Bacidia gigantensis]|uniref:uncharacterized protein n=1 Tax=Bacidia gigantensis TaxID=2732470 RepID=UPI001D04471D|nr:uncharacterized protein KY384_008048 [Bacidia gigantensis]KAG8527304.1 hypothetical protein KY384_008048 [Bacidia gigantensis]
MQYSLRLRRFNNKIFGFREGVSTEGETKAEYEFGRIGEIPMSERQATFAQVGAPAVGGEGRPVAAALQSNVRPLVLSSNVRLYSDENTKIQGIQDDALNMSFITDPTGLTPYHDINPTLLSAQSEPHGMEEDAAPYINANLEYPAREAITAQAITQYEPFDAFTPLLPTSAVMVHHPSPTPLPATEDITIPMSDAPLDPSFFQDTLGDPTD